MSGFSALATIVFGLSTNFRLSLVALAVLGAADMISVYIRSSLIQLHTPDAMRGRVSSVSMLFVSAWNELGEFESGITAAWLGPVEAVVVGGIGAIIVTGALGLGIPGIAPRRPLCRTVPIPANLDGDEKPSAAV